MAGRTLGRRPITDGVLAGAVAGVVSGLPSTATAIMHRKSPWTATRAAGSLLGRPTVPRAALAHGVVSLGWGVVLSQLLGRRHLIAQGLLAAGLIAAFDLGVVGRRFPAIRQLDLAPQVADHLAFGLVVGVVLTHMDAARSVAA